MVVISLFLSIKCYVLISISMLKRSNGTAGAGNVEHKGHSTKSQPVFEYSFVGKKERQNLAILCELSSLKHGNRP